jgi:hypothetical protein
MRTPLLDQLHQDDIYQETDEIELLNHAPRGPRIKTQRHVFFFF